jgi:hypothetical protein
MGLSIIDLDNMDTSINIFQWDFDDICFILEPTSVCAYSIKFSK